MPENKFKKYLKLYFLGKKVLSPVEFFQICYELHLNLPVKTAADDLLNNFRKQSLTFHMKHWLGRKFTGKLCLIFLEKEN